MYVTDGSCNEVIAIVRRIFVKFGLTLRYDGFLSIVYLACRAGVTILFEATTRVHNVEDLVLIIVFSPILTLCATLHTCSEEIVRRIGFKRKVQNLRFASPHTK